MKSNEMRDLPNPYDFANPVNEERFFFGRSPEISDLIYYLNHTKTTRRPIHLALVGARASGKTSFLNVAESEAKRRELCTVRINLNEGDVKTDLAFFRKLLHSIIMSAFKFGAFGGINGAAYFAYIEMTATYEIKNIEEIPFISAAQIAFAQKSGNKEFNIPDDILMEDLSKIYSEIKKPILICIDECNVLRENRIVVEKLRNIFMNLEGYMLLLAATEDFFPVMDEIFSPIMRQFRRIDIGPFKSESDVADCIRHPLNNIGMSRADIRKIVSLTFIRDVDVLSGRRPYEIQLICHSLFRQIQDGISKRFSLDLKTLEAIQRELASGQKIDERPIIRAAKQTKRISFSALNAISGGDEKLTRENWWAVEYLFNGVSKWTRERLFDAFNDLKASGIITESESGIEFAGDDFDRLYIKYIARQKGANIGSVKQPFEVAIFNKLLNAFAEFQALRPLGALQSADYIDSFVHLLPLFDLKIPVADLEKKSLDPLAEDLLAQLLEKDGRQHVKIVEIFFSSSLGSCQAWFMWDEPEHEVGLKRLQRRIDDMRQRAEEVGFGLECYIHDLQTPEPTALLDRIAQLGNEQLAVRLSTQLMDKMATIYIEEHDLAKARYLVETAFAMSGSRMSPAANNVGYLYMACGDFEEAKRWFEAAKQYASQEDSQLLEYNMGILAALTGHYGDSKLSLLRSKGAHIPVEAACIYRIYLEEGELKHEEVVDPPSITSLAEQAIEVVNHLSANLAHA